MWSQEVEAVAVLTLTSLMHTLLFRLMEILLELQEWPKCCFKAI